MAVKFGEVSIESVAALCARGDVFQSVASLMTLAQVMCLTSEKAFWSLSVILCHTACEVATEKTIDALRQKAGLERNGYSKIHRECVQREYERLTGGNVTEWEQFQDWAQTVKVRNAIVHDGMCVDQEPAKECFRLTTGLIARMQSATSCQSQCCKD